MQDQQFRSKWYTKMVPYAFRTRALTRGASYLGFAPTINKTSASCKEKKSPVKFHILKNYIYGQQHNIINSNNYWTNENYFLADSGGWREFFFSSVKQCWRTCTVLHESLCRIQHTLWKIPTLLFHPHHDNYFVWRNKVKCKGFGFDSSFFKSQFSCACVRCLCQW